MSPTPDYFRFFGLDRRLSLDPADLQRRFYELSRLIHPDRYARRSPNEQRYALEATAILNDAYRVLRDPVARAEYVLKEEGLETAEEKAKNVPPELLEEVFDLNLALEELRDGDEAARPRLEAELARFGSMRDEIDREMESRFAEYDRTRERAALAAIRSLLDRRRYIHNLAKQAGKELGEHAA